MGRDARFTGAAIELVSAYQFIYTLLFNPLIIGDLIMLCSKLIIALCDTDEEVTKFVHFNQRESLVRYMQDLCMGYKHICGTPKANANYLMVDVQLDGAVPDLMFEHRSKGHIDQIFGYIMEEPATLTGTVK